VRRLDLSNCRLPELLPQLLKFSRLVSLALPLHRRYMGQCTLADVVRALPQLETLETCSFSAEPAELQEEIDALAALPRLRVLRIARRRRVGQPVCQVRARVHVAGMGGYHRAAESCG
jgi:hypothetical protein